MFASLNLLKVNSNDVETQRKAALLQGLVAVLIGLSVLRAIFEIVQPSQIPSTVAVFQLIISLLFGLLTLFIIRTGKIRLAAHFFFGILNFIFFFLLVTTTRNLFFPYLMLISVVAIATLDSVKASLFYSALTLASVSAFFILSDMFSLLAIVEFLVTCLGISIVAWATAEYLQSALRNSKLLANELMEQSNLLERRAHQLRFGAEIAEQGSSSLDLDQLLRDTAVLLKSQFSFYHVSLFLTDAQRKMLHLREVATDVPVDLINLRYKLPIDNHSIVGWVGLHRKARVVDDVQIDPAYKEEPFLPNTRAELALPLVARGELLGVLDVQGDRPGIFAREDVSILQIIANQIAINIDNARLFAQTETRLNEARILYEYNSLLSSTLDVGELHRRAARALTTWLQASRCTIFVWEPEENRVAAQVDFIYDLATGAIDQFGLDLATHDLAEHPGMHKALTTGQAKVWHLEDGHLDAAERDQLEENQQHSCLDVPLVQGGRSLGLVRLYRSQGQSNFTDNEIQLAQAMANETAVSLANATLTSETQARVAQLSSLNRLSLALSEAPNLNQVYKATRREILSLVEATGLAIFLVADDQEHLNWLYLYDYGEEIDLSDIPPLSLESGFSGHVVRTRSTLHIQATPENQAKFNSFQVGKTDDYHEFWLGLPLIVTNRLIGVLSLQNLEPFSDRDIQLLTTIAGALSIAINNLLQLVAVQDALAIQFEQRLQMQTAAEVSAATTSILNLETLTQEAVNLIKERFELYYVGLFLVDEKYAVLKAGTGSAGAAQIAARRQLLVGGQSLVGGATNDGKPRITHDVAIDPEWLPNPHLPNTRSELALPLRVRGETIGALTVQSEQVGLFNDDLIGTLQIMADQLAVAIQNAELLAQAESRAQQQAYLNEISAKMHQSADVEAIVRVGLQALSKQLNGTAVALQLGRQNEDS
ncbi:GAF domain-containing protein [Candidatus Leptofilum sp.]|uniref:GAF domain-containing protein n=1 Tax=Candidatus Leptofilum sp. TaxID=3241576 RepID=UPI003B5A80CC